MKIIFLVKFLNHFLFTLFYKRLIKKNCTWFLKRGREYGSKHFGEFCKQVIKLVHSKFNFY